MRDCRICLDAGHDIVPGGIFSGEASARLMLIGQAPGVTEVEAQRPFNASSGRRLFQWLAEAGWEEDAFRARHYMTAVTKCYPGKASNGKGDRVPSRAEQKLCRPYLEAEIRLVNPRVIMPVGGLAIRLFWPSKVTLAQVIGRAAYFPPEYLHDPVNFKLKQAEILDRFDSTKPKAGRWVVPIPHPSGASLWPNKPANQAKISRAMEILGELRLAMEL